MQDEAGLEAVGLDAGVDEGLHHEEAGREGLVAVDGVAGAVGVALEGLDVEGGGRHALLGLPVLARRRVHVPVGEASVLVHVLPTVPVAAAEHAQEEATDLAHGDGDAVPHPLRHPGPRHRADRHLEGQVGPVGVAGLVEEAGEEAGGSLHDGEGHPTRGGEEMGGAVGVAQLGNGAVEGGHNKRLDFSLRFIYLIDGLEGGDGVVAEDAQHAIYSGEVHRVQPQEGFGVAHQDVEGAGGYVLPVSGEMVRHGLAQPDVVVVEDAGLEGVGDGAHVRGCRVFEAEPLMGSPHRGPLGGGGDTRRGGSRRGRTAARGRGSTRRGSCLTALATNSKVQGLAGGGGERIHGRRRT